MNRNRSVLKISGHPYSNPKGTVESIANSLVAILAISEYNGIKRGDTHEKTKIIEGFL